MPAPDAGSWRPLAAAPWAGASSARVSAGAARTEHGDAHRTHRARGKGPRDAPHLVWRTDVGGPVEAQVTASPDEQALYVSTLGGKLIALGRDGHVLFSLDLHDRVYSTPCVGDDGTVYVGSDGKKFYAVLPSGIVRWKLETEEEVDTGAVFAPNGTLVFAAGRTVYAVRTGGDVAWRFRARKKVFTAPAVGDDGTVYFGSQDHHVYAVNSEGSQVFAADLGADVDGGPVIGDDGTVYVGTDADDVVRLGPKGEVVWRAPVGGFVRGPLSIGRDGDILAGVYGPLPQEVRIEAASGKFLGGFVIPGTGAREFGVHGGALEDDEGNLYFGGQDDQVHALGRDGRILWQFSTQGDVDAPLTLLKDGLVIVPSDDGHVYALGP